MYRYMHVYILMDFFLDLSVEEGKDLEARDRERERFFFAKSLRTQLCTPYVEGSSPQRVFACVSHSWLRKQENSETFEIIFNQKKKCSKHPCSFDLVP